MAAAHYSQVQQAKDVPPGVTLPSEWQFAGIGASGPASGGLRPPHSTAYSFGAHWLVHGDEPATDAPRLSQRVMSSLRQRTLGQVR
jgi:hypothetical protein